MATGEVMSTLDCTVFRRTLSLVSKMEMVTRKAGPELTTHSLGQTFVLIKGWAAGDPLLPDVLPSLIDFAEVTVTAILDCLTMLKGKRRSG